MQRLIAVACLFLAGGAVADDPPAPVAAANAQLPIEFFTRRDELGTIKISPDGETIAMTLSDKERSVLAFVRLSDHKIIGGVKAPDPFQMGRFHWISKNRVIYFITERHIGLKQPVPTGEIFAVNSDGSKNVMLYGYRNGEGESYDYFRRKQSTYATAKLISELRNDDENILIAEYPWRQRANYWSEDRDAQPMITRLNVFSGQKKPLGAAPLRRASVLVDRNDEVRFAIGQNQTFQTAVSWKPQPGAPWQEFALPGFQASTLEPSGFSADNNCVVFAGVREGESLRNVYRLNLQTLAVDKLYGYDGVDVSGIVMDFAGREIIGVRADTSKAEYHWLAEDDPSAKLHMALERTFPQQSVEITSVTEDGRLVIAFVSSDRNPGDYYLFDTRAKNAELVRAMREWIEPRLMRPKEAIEVTARDGLKLHAYLTRPAGDGPHPLIVLPHGGPHGIRDSWDFDDEAQLFANRGYAVLQVNFRGSGGYGVAFEAAGYRQLGASMQDDVTDATRWAIEHGVAPANRICIYGASYGGFAALMGVAREPDLYRCAIGLSGVYDLELMLSSADIPGSQSGRAYLDLALGSDIADLHARSPAYNAERIKAPVLLIHGKSDWRADYGQMKRMKSALEKYQKPVETMASSREGHYIYDEQTRREMYERILAFLDKNLRSE
jgi:dipeptidyl aminopeptidase/acylaminoacyl peptidase